MMYMPDAIKAAMDLMGGGERSTHSSQRLQHYRDEFCPRAIAAAIKKHLPDFVMRYAIDPVRQAIAESWPRHMDDSAARKEWGWQPDYDLEAMVKDMLENLSHKSA